jgi:type II secretory pathway pseudopilin PulG
MIVVTLLVVAAAIAIPSLVAARRAAASRSAVTTTVNALAVRRAQAARGGTQVFTASAEIVRDNSRLVINPPEVAPPDGMRTAEVLTFQGGTGHLFVEGRRQPAAIVFRNPDDPSEVYAVIVGSTARVHATRRTPAGWEDIER